MNKVKCQFTWIAIKKLEKEYIFSKNNLFTITKNNGTFRKVSDNYNENYLLFNLIPKAEFFHAVISFYKKKLGIEIKQKKPPFVVFIPYLHKNVSFSFSIKFSPPNIILLLVKLSIFSIELDCLSSLTLTENFQKLFAPIYNFTTFAISLAELQKQTNHVFSGNIKYKPLIHIDCPCDGLQFQDYFNINKTLFVTTLMRSRNQDISHDIINRILDKNNFHNQKSHSEVVLIDKQCVVYLTPSKEQKSNLWYRSFIEVFKLYEIALLFQELILSRIWQKKDDDSLFDLFICVADKWISKEDCQK